MLSDLFCEAWGEITNPVFFCFMTFSDVIRCFDFIQVSGIKVIIRLHHNIYVCRYISSQFYYYCYMFHVRDRTAFSPHLTGKPLLKFSVLVSSRFTSQIINTVMNFQRRCWLKEYDGRLGVQRSCY